MVHVAILVTSTEFKLVYNYIQKKNSQKPELKREIEIYKIRYIDTDHIVPKVDQQPEGTSEPSYQVVYTMAKLQYGSA